MTDLQRVAFVNKLIRRFPYGNERNERLIALAPLITKFLDDNLMQANTFLMLEKEKFPHAFR